MQSPVLDDFYEGVKTKCHNCPRKFLVASNLQTEVWKGQWPSEKLFVRKAADGEIECFSVTHTRRAFTRRMEQHYYLECEISKRSLSLQYAFQNPINIV